MLKKAMTFALLATLMTLGISMVSAHEGDAPPPPNGAPELVEEYTGLTRDDLRDALTNGATLTELIEANGQSVDDFVAAATEAFETRLNEAVEAGRIDEAEAAEKLAEFTANLSNLDDFPFREARPPRDGNHPSGLLEEYTGLTPEALRDALQDGATAQELIEANGQSVEAFTAAVTAEFETRLNEAVEAGRIDEAEAAERLAEFTEQINNGEFPAPRPPRPDGSHPDGGRPDGRGR